jgi:FdhD protein
VVFSQSQLESVAVTDSPVRIAPVRRFGVHGAAPADTDLLAVEEPLLLEIEHGPAGARSRVNAGVMLRTPGHDRHLVLGLLFAEGFIATADAVAAFETPAPGHLRVHLAADLRFEERLARRMLARASACGLCGRDAIDDLAGIGGRSLPAGPSIAASVIQSLPAQLRARQVVFNETGGLHAAAFFDAAGGLLAAAEDIGRHNAVDKLVGAHLRAPAASAPPAILLVSGRGAFEIVHKAVMARVPVLAAVGAPSSLAVETARAFNLTVAGFLREDRFNIYSGFDRIV